MDVEERVPVTVGGKKYPFVFGRKFPSVKTNVYSPLQNELGKNINYIFISGYIGGLQRDLLVR